LNSNDEKDIDDDENKQLLDLAHDDNNDKEIEKKNDEEEMSKRPIVTINENILSQRNTLSRKDSIKS